MRLKRFTFKASIAFLCLLGFSVIPRLSFASNIVSTSVDTVFLSLEETIDRAMTFDPTIQLTKTDAEIRKVEEKQSLAVILPRVDFSITGMRTNDPLNVFGTRLLQEKVVQADFNPNRLNAPEPLGNWQAKVEVMQPLIQAEGYYQRKAIQAAVDAQELVLDRTKEGITLQTTQQYLYWVLALETVTVIEESLRAAEKNYSDAIVLHDEGILDRADLLSAKLFAEQLSLQKEQQESLAATAADMLKRRIGVDADTMILPTTTSISFSDNSTITANIDTRADIRALHKALEAEKAIFQSKKSKFLPTVGAFGSYQWNDENVLFGEGENYMLGIQAKIPVFNGGITIGAVQKQKLSVKKAQIQLQDQSISAKNEFRESERMLQLAQRQLEVSDLGRSQAEEAYRIKKNRHDEGLVRTFELIQVQTMLLEQKLSYLKASFDYQLAIKQRAFAAN